MKNFRLGLLTLCFGLSIAHADEVALQTDAWCPYSCDSNAANRGILVDVAESILKKAGHTLVYSHLNWARAVVNVREGKADGLIDAYKSDAPDFIFPDEPIISSQMCFFTKSTDNWKFSGYDSLKGRKISVVNDYSYGEQFDKYIRDNTDKGDNSIRLLSGMDLTSRRIQMIASDRIDTIVEDGLVLPHASMEFQEVSEYKAFGGFKNVGCLPSEGLYIAFSPNKSTSKVYAELIADGVRKMKKSGELEKIVKKYQ